MRTAKPISTITWCSPEDIYDKLCELQRANVISYFCYICHLGEKGDRESGGKNHIHLYVEPAKLLQTMELRNELTVMDMTNGKPIVPLDFHHSDFSNWFMYCLHDANYLASKNLTREYTYTPEQMKYSSKEEFDYRVANVDISNAVPVSKIKKYVESGLSFDEMVSRGLVPLGQINNWAKAYECIINIIPKKPKKIATELDDDSLETVPPTMYVPQDLPFQGEIRIYNPGSGVWPKLPQ